jgi:F0F1-type ATP synthase membrane subunit b/b'
MLKIMDESMKHLSGIHKDFEEVRKRFAEQEAEVTSKVKDIRAQADLTRATADQVTSECRKHHESKERAEREFANADKEWRGLVQELGIF